MREPWVIQEKKNVYSIAGTVQLFHPVFWWGWAVGRIATLVNGSEENGTNFFHLKINPLRN